MGDQAQPGPADRDRERLRPAEHELDRCGDEDQARRRHRRARTSRRARPGRATASTSSAGTSASAARTPSPSRTGGSLRARPRAARAPSRASARSAGSSAAARRARRARLRHLRGAEQPDRRARCGRSRASAARSRCRSEISPVYAALWATKRMIGPRSSPSGRRLRRREPAAGPEADARGSRRVVTTWATTTPGHRRGHAVLRADAIPASRRPIESVSQRAAQVVAAAEDQRRGRDRLQRLQRRQGRGERAAARRARPPCVEDRAGERGERDDQRGRDERGRELERERDPDEPVESAPVLARGVAEAVLDERVVARQPRPAARGTRRAPMTIVNRPAPRGPEHAQDDQRRRRRRARPSRRRPRTPRSPPRDPEGEHGFRRARCRRRSRRGARGRSAERPRPLERRHDGEPRPAGCAAAA